MGALVMQYQAQDAWAAPMHEAACAQKLLKVFPKPHSAKRACSLGDCTGWLNAKCEFPTFATILVSHVGVVLEYKSGDD